MIKVFSYGGGVQSTAALVLAAQGKIDYTTFLFCNVGDDSENPDTILYVRNVAMPYAQAHNLDLIELSRPNETLLGRITGEANRGYVIPAYTPTKQDRTDGAPGKRNCTQDFKVEVVAKWTKEHGATKATPTVIGMGISLDEIGRMKPSSISWETFDFPLIDLRLDRLGCMNTIRQAGLPVPPKSSCWFCPYHRLSVWQEMREDKPDLFWKAVELEKTLQERQKARGLPIVYLTRRLKPLDQLTTDDYKQSSWLVDDMCDSGYCMM